MFCVGAGADTANLRILLMHPTARGRGVGRAPVDACLEFARGAGYRRIQLWTNDPLVAARRICLERGFVLLEQSEHHSFGVDLVGQTYQLDLTRSP